MGTELAWDQAQLKNYKVALDEHSIVATTDIAGRIIYANNTFCAISQYSQHELLGHNHRILNSGHHPKSFFAKMWREISAGKVWKGDIKNRAKNGSFYWVKTTIVPFKNAQGRVFQYVSVRTDITDKVLAEQKIAKAKKRLEKAAQQLKAERTLTSNKNIALNEVIAHLESEKLKIRATINSNIESILFPLFNRFKNQLSPKNRKQLDQIEATLLDISTPIIRSPDVLLQRLTPKELQICNDIKHGLSIKEIARLMHLSPRTIEKHRENIRSKLGLKSSKINLTTYLMRTL